MLTISKIDIDAKPGGLYFADIEKLRSACLINEINFELTSY